MNIIISEILLQNLAWNILGCQTFRRYHRNWQDSRDRYWFNNIFLYCPHNHLLYKLWLELMLQLVIFLEPKCIYIFPSFDFHHFWELLVDGNKKKIHYKQFKTPKTKFLGPFTDTTHANKCGFAFRRHSSGDCIFLINLCYIQIVLFLKPILSKSSLTF